MQVQIDNRGGIVLFKITTPGVKDAKGEAGKTKVSYRTYPADHVNESEFAKNFDALFAARATMPPIPDTSKKTLSKVDQEAARTVGPGKRK